MKAAVLFGKGDLRVTDFPEPELTDGSVRVKVSHCGVCGTDFHKFAGKAGSRPVKYPVPLGHEISGTVVALGKDVRDFQIGDRVTVDPNWSCGRCWYCKNGRRHLCSASKGVVKGMAEFVCPPAENVYKLPDSLSFRDASLAEPLSCCLHGVDLLDLKQGESVCIVGYGAIGALMLQLLSGKAGPVIVIETAEEKRSAALEAGAALFIDPAKEDPAEAIHKAGIECVEKVIECVGLPATAATAIEVAGKGATVVLFGVADPEAVLPLKQYELFSKELVLKASYINPYTMGRAIELLAKKAIDADKAISRVIPLEDLPEEIATRKYSRLGKVVVTIDG